MPITRTIGPFELSEDTEEQVSELLEVGKSTYFVEVSSLRLENGENNGKPLRDALLKLVDGRVMLMGKWEESGKAETVVEVKIGREYPKVELNRNKCREALVRFS